MLGHIIKLTPEITEYADNVAALRQGQAFMKSRKNMNGLSGDFDKMLAIHRLGARCEAAAKLFLNPIKWNALSDKITGLADLGGVVDVKGRTKSWYELVVQKNDEDHFAFLLVTAEYHPNYNIVGWMWGREAKDQKFWREHVAGRAAYFVPHNNLSPPEELFRHVHHEAKMPLRQTFAGGS